MAKIRIVKSLCKQCGRCVDICPEGLFVQDAPPPDGSAPERRRVPRIVRQKDCIECGHCASICPTGAVVHPNFLFEVHGEMFD